MYLQGNGISGSKNGGTGYGYMLFIENSDMNKVYVLCHILPDMWKKGTVINQPVCPDMTVAKVGNIGNSSGPHLHLTVIDCSWKNLCMFDGETFEYKKFQKLNYKRIDPFDNGIYWKLPK